MTKLPKVIENEQKILMNMAEGYSDGLDNLTIKVKHNKATVTGDKNGVRVRTELTKYDNGIVEERSMFKNDNKKSERKEDVMRLLKAGATQNEVAEKTGLSQSTISKWKNNI